MALLIQYRADRVRRWVQALKSVMPDLDVRVWPDDGDPNEIDAVLTFAPEPGSLKKYPNLKLIASTGAGVDLLLDPSRDLPDGVPIVRLVDEELTKGMAEYVLATVLRYHRQFERYEQFQREGHWQQLPWLDTTKRTVGILGLGVLGSAAAKVLHCAGFSVGGWSRRPTSLAGVECYHGPDDLVPFLGRTSILVCLLSLTPATEGIINRRTLAALPRGAYVINPARGGHVADADLIAALDSGHIAHATLDIFRTEPLAPDHPFWRHPKITVTPHIASRTVPEAAAAKVIENVRRAREGLPLLNLVDRRERY